MNMQDYRHAADRVHIAEHCEKEVLSMTQNTEQKTRRPLLRTATGIAAAAACVGLTGALGFALYRMGHDEADLPAADSAGTESVTEQSAADSAEESSQIGTAEETYEDFAAAYYEKAAGHHVNYDWSSLCGTDLNEVWETEGGTVTLKAAVTDGYQLYFYYTFKPNFDWNSVNWDEPLNEETGKLMPNLIVVPADLHLQENLRYGDSPTVWLDDTQRFAFTNSSARKWPVCRCRKTENLSRIISVPGDRVRKAAVLPSICRSRCRSGMSSAVRCILPMTAPHTASGAWKRITVMPL